MLIRCPWCDVPSEIDSAAVADAVLSCAVCGMRWNPADQAARAQRPPVRKPSVALVPVRREDIEDGIVIDHIGPAFQGRVPPRRPAPRAAPPPAAVTKPPVDHARTLKLAGAVLGAVLLAAAVSVPFVMSYPGVASVGGGVENASALAFRNVKSHTVVRGGAPTLVVEGEVVNRSGTGVDLPAIRVTLRAADGSEVDSRLVEPTALDVGPGEAVGFKSAFTAPGNAVAKVTLSLAARERQLVMR
jgi:hypothetical protein